ncbi:TPA: alpha/beta fold hydrolase [Bacillus cereus]|nr:alpha/beta fold hydrolase [Bacillus cereus]
MNKGNYVFSFLVRNKDYIVRDHRVHNVRAVPGVTFVDTIYRYLKMKQFPLDQVELRNLIFIEPVVTTEQFDRKVRVTLTESKGMWVINIQSQKIKDDVVIGSEWSEHLKGELHVNPNLFEHFQLDIEHLKIQAKQIEDMDYSYAMLRHVGIDHYEFMKLLGRIYIGEGYVLAEVHTSELAKNYLDYFYLHPAHLDGSTSLPGIFARQNMNIDTINISSVIPIYIGSFRTNGQFGDKQYVFVKEKKLITPKSKDVFYADIEFYRADGKRIASYSKFGYKSVRTKESITDLQKVQLEYQTDTPIEITSIPFLDTNNELMVKETILQDLQSMIACTLGCDTEEIGAEDDFYELGLDSKNLVNLVKELEEKIGEKLYPTLLFEHTNISSLSEYLLEDYAEIYPIKSSMTDTVIEQSSEQIVVSEEKVVKRSLETKNHVKEDCKQTIVRDLKSMIARTLGCDTEEIGVEDDFYELGLDSKNLVNLVKELEEKIGEKLYPTLLFEHTNISGLSEYLLEDYAEIYPIESPMTDTVIEQSSEQIVVSEDKRSLETKNHVKEDCKQTIVRDLKSMIARILGCDAEEVGVEDDFYELGLDSKNLVNLVKELEEKIGEKLYPTLFFEHTNISGLSEYLLEDYAEIYPIENPITDTVIEQSKKQKDVSVSVVSQEPADVLYYRPVWVKQKFLELTDTPFADYILVFDGDSELREALQKQVKQYGTKILWIKFGNSFNELSADEGIFEINPLITTDYEELFDYLQEKGLSFEKIIHAWSNGETEITADNLDEQLNQSVNPLLHMGKALVNRKLKNIIKVFYLYRTYEDIQLLNAATVGFNRSVSMEHSKLHFKTIEVRTRENFQWPINLPEMLLKEFRIDDVNIHSICYAGEERFIRSMQLIKVHDVDKKEAPLLLRKSGVYLISGGLGGLGIHFARHLAREYQANLVLFGRSKITAEQQLLLDELESFGAQVMYMQGDLGNREDLERIIKEVYSRYGAIHGVIHSAGLISDSILLKKEIKDFRSVLIPKIDGTLLLDEVLNDINLDFFVMFSSTSAVTGNVGQADYAFANSFLDHMAIYRQRLVKKGKRFGKTLSINWPFWQDGGMKVDEQTTNLMRETMGMQPLRTDNGIQAFHGGLNQPYSNLITIEGNVDKINASLATCITENADEISKVTYKNEQADDVEILGVSRSKPTKSFMNVWTRMMKHETSKIGSMNIEKDKLLPTIKKGGHMFHLLVQLDPGRKLEVIVSGKGTPVLFINGFGFTATSLVYQLNELTKSHQLINIHHPSIGLSNGDQDLTLSGLARTYIEVLEKLQIKGPVHVIASSWGGMVAQTIAKEYPKKIASLTLACSFVDLDFFENGMKLNEKLKEEFYHLGFEEYYKLVEKSIYKNFRGTAGYFKYFAKSVGQQYSTKGIMSEITVPTLVVSGAKDMVVPPEYSQLLAKQINNSQYFELPEAGHVPHITHYELFNQRVLEFMKEQESLDE